MKNRLSSIWDFSRRGSVVKISMMIRTHKKRKIKIEDNSHKSLEIKVELG